MAGSNIRGAQKKTWDLRLINDGRVLEIRSGALNSKKHGVMVYI